MEKHFFVRLTIVFISLLLSKTAFAQDARHWAKKSQSIKGSWNIEQRDNGDYLVLSENFKTRKGPDLKLMLSTLSIDDVNGKNASESSVTIAPLESHKGGQVLQIA